MKALQSFKERTERVDVQVSMLSCALICVSCIIMFTVTFSIMKSILRDTYGSGVDLVYNMISSHISDEVYEPGASDGELSKERSYLTAMHENMSVKDISVYRPDSDGQPVYVFDTADELLGVSVYGKKVENGTENTIEKVLDGAYYGHGDFYKIDGILRYISFYPAYNSHKQVIGVVSVALDARELYIAEQILRVLFFVIILLCCLVSVKFARTVFRRISNPLYQDVSNTDKLTGLKNKNSFTLDLHNIEVSDKARYSVISADLNGLKTINDTLGHQMGDIYLQRAAAVLREVFDEKDAACYRTGGDEFIVILKNKSENELEAAAARIEEAVEADNEGKSGVKLSISVGCARYDETKDRNFAMTIERSDRIMYENKRLYYQNKNMQPR